MGVAELAVRGWNGQTSNRSPAEMRAAESRPELMITHEPGIMFLTDLPCDGDVRPVVTPAKGKSDLGFLERDEPRRGVSRQLECRDQSRLNCSTSRAS